jgi:cytochrome P450
MTTPSKPFSNEHPITTGKDISSQEFWSKPFIERDETFGWLRENAPVSWHPPFEDPAVPQELHGEAGFWAVVRYRDIKAESQNYDLFSSRERSVPFKPQHPDLAQPPTFLEMDPPQHTRYRQVISSAFTPKGVARINDKLKERAREIIDNVEGRQGEFDFVSEVSARLPMLTIADMLGVPDDLTETFAHAGDDFIGAGDPAVNKGEDPTRFAYKKLMILREMGIDLVNDRRKNPKDDIATALAAHEVEGHHLSDDDIMSMMLLLSTAGNDTTKQTTSHTLVSLYRDPDQREWLLEDFDARIANSIEEFIRHASPVIEFGRLATADAEMGGQQISKGDKVVMFYASGNRDESVYADPHRFDLKRPKIPHVGFGGGGVHFCLGHGVAKAQLRALFREILTRLPNLEIVGEPQMLQNEFIHGIRKLSVRV